MKAGKRHMVNRSTQDRRKTTVTQWQGAERRKMASEKRKEWQRVSTWKSTHKPLKYVDFTDMPLL